MKTSFQERIQGKSILVEGQPEQGVSEEGSTAGDRLDGKSRPGRGRPVYHSEECELDPEDSGPDRLHWQEGHHSNVHLGKGPSLSVTAADKGTRRGLAFHLNILRMKLTLSFAFCGLYTLFEIDYCPLSVSLSSL